MINKRGFKRIYGGDIVEVLSGEFTGYRYFVECDMNDDLYGVFVIGGEPDYFRHGEYFLWRSPLRNKLKRLRDKLWKRSWKQ